ncbi:Rrf2 family transcriptional regulator [Vibrio fluvialis]|uniref:Rrf2 family transcriptional regulator n=1 Tax=Vibrio fluvialis TaxID=676 RepID=UPI001BB00C13|nr:Rrf2 family transcriptional regulator [Vibrio fluvialis]EKO3438860.1 Rrf2 family transcriptional regulator [Vibrio fluvialis]EKO5125280.1 Rrf2 family transcriptional regulator [Vibrio fluvialis]ELI1838662.1 Rrf2 family transcriptional regulator [Vibrio fluvialis]ELL9330980.1 Rrf2 family transcriptional regulator [Vibrio fluvialis]MBY8309836.1 Rrf2 family transcriptional regulator [Vibrio fluvialis]
MAADNTQFSIAVHILVGITKYEHVNTSQLAQSVNTNPIFIKRIAGKLAKNGLLNSSRGRNGGNCLVRDAKDISLLDVYRAVNAPTLFSIHQYEKVASCSISSNIQETLTDVRSDLQNALEQKLSQLSIQDILDDINLRK